MEVRNGVVSKESKPVKKKNILDLPSLALQLYNNIQNLRIVGAITLKRLETELNTIQTFLESVIEKVNDIAQDNKQEHTDPDLREFTIQLKQIVDEIKLLVERISKDGTPTAQILEAVNLVLVRIPLLLESVQHLNIGSFTSNLPATFDDLPKMIYGKISKMANGFLTKNMQELGEKLLETTLSVDDRSLAEFSNLSPIAQRGIVIGMEKINKLISAAVTSVDEIEIQLSLKEGSILNEIRPIQEGYDLRLMSKLPPIDDKSLKSTYVIVQGPKPGVYLFDEMGVQHEIVVGSGLANIFKEIALDSYLNVDLKSSTNSRSIKNKLTPEQIKKFNKFLRSNKCLGIKKDRTLTEWAAQFSRAYSERVKVARVKQPDELFPYPSTKLQTRKLQLEKLIKLQESDVEPTEWQSAIANSIVLIDIKMKENNKKSKQDEAKNAALKCLKEELTKAGSNYESAIKTATHKHSQILNNSDYKKLFIDITSVFVNAKKLIVHKNTKLVNQINRMKEMIRILEQSKDLVDIDALKKKADKDNADLEKNISGFAQESIEDLRSFFADTEPSTSNSESDTQTLELVSKYLQDIEDELRKTLDPIIFNKFFVSRNENARNIDAASSWIEDAGNSFKSAKRLVDTLSRLKKEFEKNEALDGRENLSAQEQINKTIDIMKKTRDSLTALVSAAKQFSRNPFIRENAKAIKKLIKERNFKILRSSREKLPLVDEVVKTVTDGAKEFSDHPVIDFVKVKGIPLVKKLLGDNKLTTIASNLKLFYKQHALKFGQDPETKARVTKALKNMTKLADDSHAKLQNDDANSKDVVLFIWDHLEILVNTMSNAQQVVSSISNLSKEKALMTIQELNNMVKGLLLLADRIESELYLKQDYIVSKFSINGKPIYLILEELQEALEGQGYEFKPEERFPYIAAIQTQRAQLLGSKSDQIKDIDTELKKIQGRQTEIIDVLTKQGNEARNLLVAIETSRKDAFEQLSKLFISSKLHMNAAVKNIIKNKVIPIFETELRHTSEKFVALDPLDVDLARSTLSDRKIDTINRLDELNELVDAPLEDAPLEDAPLEDVDNNTADQIMSFVVKYDELEKTSNVVMRSIECADAIAKCKSLKDENHNSSLEAKKAANIIAEQEAIIENSSEEYKKLRLEVKHLKAIKQNCEESRSVLMQRFDSEKPLPILADDERTSDNNFKTVINRIDIKLAALRKRREERFFFFASSRRTDLEHRIMGLSELRARYLQNGNTVDNALYQVSANHGAFGDALAKHDKEMLSQIKKIDRSIPEEMRGKIVIDYLNKSPSLPNVSENRVKKITERIDELTAKYNSLFNRITHVKEKKVKLLSELRDELKNSSLDDAIKTVRSNNLKTFYLMFEGETGKVLKDLRLSTLSKDDMIRSIEAEIERLKMELSKSSVLLFFKGTSKDSIKERRDALIQFQIKGFNLDELKPAEKNILLKHEKHLIQDIYRWNEISIEDNNKKRI